MTEPSDKERQAGLELRGLRRRVEALEEALARAKRVGDTLRESNTLLNALLENTDDFILFSNRRGEPMFFNSAYARVMKDLLGLEMKPGVKPHEHLEDPAAKAWWDGLHARVLGGEKFRVEYAHHLPDGTARHFEVAFNPIWVRDEVQGFSEYTREITALRRAEAERAELQEQLLQAQKMEALGKLAGGMAHDFNNLLAVIMGNAELLVEGPGLGPEDRARAHKIVKVTQRARDLTQKLLAFARREKPVTRPVALGELGLDLLEILQGSVPKNVIIETAFEGSHAAVEVASGQVTLALLNVCINACDAMPEGGTLRLEHRVVERPPPGAEPGAPARRWARFRCCDTGPGMNEEQRARIFEPFYTTKPAGRGTGLGLAVSLGIVQSHRGFIEVESAPGEGTAVDIHLPISSATPVPVDPVPAPAPDPLGRGLTALVVDDEADFRAVLSDQLALLGFEVHCVSSGAQAVAFASERGGALDVVFLDLVMPGMDGRATFEELARAAPGARVVLCSGYSQEGIAAALLEAGARAHLQKPFEHGELRRVVRRVLRGGAAPPEAPA